MDHRWDETLQAEHRRRAEQGRYGARTIDNDPDVRRRDQLELARRRINKSPWEVGAAHWDQRDLYTRNSLVNDAGYGRGPSIHPEVGSYAYPRRAEHDAPASRREGPSLYEREAWPWLNYDRFQPVAPAEGGVWEKVKHGASRVMGALTGHHAGAGPRGWRRSDESVREDACEALAFDPHLDASDITVTVKDGEITLEGTVPDRPSKRHAETLVEHLRGVEDVHNRLQVRKDDDDLAFTAPIPAY